MTTAKNSTPSEGPAPVRPSVSGRSFRLHFRTLAPRTVTASTLKAAEEIGRTMSGEFTRAEPVAKRP